MTDNNLKSLIKIQNIELAKVGNIIKITDKILARSERIYVPFLKKNNKYTYVDLITLDPIFGIGEYDDALLYREGLAMVKVNEKWGFINKIGNEIVSIKYNMLNEFSEGLAAANLNFAWGFVNKVGEVVIPFLENAWVRNFSDGLAAVESLRYSGFTGFIDKDGLEIIRMKNNHMRVYPFSEGLAWVVLNEKWGLIDKLGFEIVPMKYDSTGIHFSEGLAAVCINKKWGFIDKNGEEVIQLKYSFANNFSEGLALVKFNGKWSFIDRTGVEVIKLKYNSAGSFSDGFARVGESYRKWGFIDKFGVEVIPIIYDRSEDFSEGLAMVKIDDKWGFIEKSGKLVIQFKYDWGYLDEFGVNVCGRRYENTNCFSNGLARVEINKVHFFVNKFGIEFREI